MGTEVSFEGMDELLANLQRLGDSVSKVENKALRAGAEIMRRAISIRAPRSSSGKEHAADHIAISRVRTSDGMKFVHVGIEKTGNSKWFYLKFFEYGTSKMSARPFMDPAARESEKQIVEAMAEVVRDGLKQ